MHMMLKLTSAVAFLAIGAVLACSDNDGSDVQPIGPPGMGGSAGSGMSGAAGSMSGSGGTGGGGTSGTGGSGGTGGGTSGTGGSGGSSGGPPGCTPADAGAPDTGDAGDGDAGDGDGGLGDASTDGGISGTVSFAADVHPILVASCGPCHVTDSSGGHNVGSEDVDAAYADAVEYGAAILERTNGGGMPPAYAAPPNNCAGGPGDPGCLSVQEYAQIQTWVAQCYPR